MSETASVGDEVMNRNQAIEAARQTVQTATDELRLFMAAHDITPHELRSYADMLVAEAELLRLRYATNRL